MKLSIDKVVVVFVLLMVSFPYTRAILPIVGDVNIKSWMLILLLITLSLRLIIKPRADKLGGSQNYPVGLLFAVFFVYFCVSVIVGRDLNLVAAQSFEYAPFLIACLILATGTSVRFEFILKGVIYAVAISGALAAYIYYFNTVLMPRDSSTGAAFLDADFAWGRLPWRNAINVLLCLSLILFSSGRRKSGAYIGVAVIIGLIALILTFSRTGLLAIIFMLIAAFIYGFKRGQILRLLRFLFVLIASVFVAINVFDFDNVINNINTRILGFLAMSSDIDISGHISDRTILYPQYFDVFLMSPLFGVGFGFPYSTNPEFSLYSDVTIVSFALPFGMLGLFLFFLFIKNLWTALKSVRGSDFSNEILGLKIVIILGLTISLNDDIWSHKEFSIILALLVSSVVNRHRSEDPVKGKLNYVV